MAEPNPINPLFANRADSIWTGKLSVLEESKFKYSQLRYPLDVDSNKRFSYWMRFNILMSIRSNYAEQLSFGNSDQFITMKNKQDELWKTREAGNVNRSSAGYQISQFFRPQVVGTKQSILLYMPDTLNWSFQNNWDEANVQEIMGKAGLAVEVLNTGRSWASEILKDISDSAGLPTNFAGKADTAAAATMESAATALGLGPAGTNLAVQATGYAFNPGVEVLYKSPTLREFQFEFIFAPRNKKEAEAVIEIIQMFKFHSAPEFIPNDAGRYYIPPSQFDIGFYGRNMMGDGGTGEIWQLGKIKSQCVLNNVTVNYGQSGRFAVFEDGTPTNIQLQLNFKETSYVTKEDVEQGF